MAKPTLLLDAQLKALRLPTFLREYDKVARQCAQEGLDCPRYLLRLCELELLDREPRATERRIKAAKFPVLKSLETFAFRAIPSLNTRLVLELALRMSWVTQCPSGSAVMPATSTRRVASSIRTSTVNRVRPRGVQTSTVKKSAAASASQCAARNSRHVLRFMRSGAGSRPCSLSTLAMVPRAT